MEKIKIINLKLSDSPEIAIEKTVVLFEIVDQSPIQKWNLWHESNKQKTIKLKEKLTCKKLIELGYLCNLKK